jgi:hypothetical protein
VRAFKFLLPGRLGPFSAFAWPVDEWVDVAGGLGCARGIHACEPADLPFWLQEELWEIELRGATVRGRHKVVAAGGRLVGRVEAWDEAAGDEFARACAVRLRALADRRPEARGHVDDLERFRPQVRPAAVASLAARAAEAVEGRPGYDAERAAQAAWLVERLGLGTSSAPA